MKSHTSGLILALAIVPALVFTNPLSTRAEFVGGVTSDGSASAVLTGVWNCRERSGSGLGSDAAKTSSDSVLVLANYSETQACACIRMIGGTYDVDSAGFGVAGGRIDLGPKSDVDIVNLCEMQKLDSGASIPSTESRYPMGVVNVVVTEGACGAATGYTGSVKGWVRTTAYLGRKRSPNDVYTSKLVSETTVALSPVPAGTIAPADVSGVCQAQIVTIYGAGDPGMIPQSLFVDYSED